MKFNSQICTSRKQGERLLALGLKKETADIRGVEGIEHTPTYAWSLHRLLSMLPNNAPKIYWVLDGANISIEFEDDGADFFPHKGDIYKGVVDCIEWLIKEGYFNKEYLQHSENTREEGR